MIRPISKPQAHRLQAGDDRVKVHTRYRNIIPGWQLRTGLICCWHATPAVCQHKDTGASPDKNCHRHQRICCFRCCRMEQLTPQLRMLSCSVQAFAQRLKKHLFISCYTSASEDLFFYFALYKYTHYYYYYYFYYYYYKPQQWKYASEMIGWRIDYRIGTARCATSCWISNHRSGVASVSPEIFRAVPIP